MIIIVIRDRNKKPSCFLLGNYLKTLLLSPLLNDFIQLRFERSWSLTVHLAIVSQLDHCFFIETQGRIKLFESSYLRGKQNDREWMDF